MGAREHSRNLQTFGRISALLTPLYTTCFMDSLILELCLTFAVFQRGWCVNEVARELEDPWWVDGKGVSTTGFHGLSISGVVVIDAARVVTRGCREGPAGLHLLRVVQHHDVVPVVITHSVASGISMLHISCERCSATLLCLTRRSRCCRRS